MFGLSDILTSIETVVIPRQLISPVSSINITQLCVCVCVCVLYYGDVTRNDYCEN